MSTLRKLRKLILRPREFAADALKARVKTAHVASADAVWLSLIVLVDNEPEAHRKFDPEAFVKGLLGRSAGRSAELDILILIDESHPQREAFDAVAKEVPDFVTIICWSELHGFAQAYTSALDQAKGQWIGHADPSSRFGGAHFTKLRRLIRQKQHGACGFVCDLQVGDAKTLRVNPTLKTPASFVMGDSASVPVLLDLQNLYLSRQILGLTGSLLSRPGWRDGLALLMDYFDAVGSGTVFYSDATKSIATDAKHHQDLFGLYPLETAQRTGQECQHILSVLPSGRPLPTWVKQRVASACARLYVRETTAMAPDGTPDPFVSPLATGLQALLSQVGYETLEELRLESFSLGLRAGMIYRHLRVLPLLVPIHVDGFDAQQSLLKLKWTCADKAQARFMRNGIQVQPIFEKSIAYRALGEPLYFEQSAWVPTAGLASLQIELHGRESPIYSKGSRLKALDGALLRSLKSAANLGDVRDPGVFILRRLAQSQWAKQRFKQAWLFLDKDDKADDNAEHFYRAIKDHPIHGGRAYFVLRRESRDWARLEAESFRLLPFGSALHKLALLNCAWLFSSHAAPFVVNLIPRKHYGDMLTYKFCFLQHGVTKDDQSAWLNSRQIDLLVTAGRPEYESMIGGRYKYTAREVALTGFPRYDALQRKRQEQPRTIVIMPTWRLKLAGKLIGKTSQRELNPDFEQSAFFQSWNSLIASTRIHESLRANGYRIVFIPHPNIKPYLNKFQIPADVEVADLEAQSIQDHLADCALLLTDYSSIAFDVAYLRRPVAYFQFDRSEFFASHTYSKGYFDYDLHGFGPVLESLPELESALLAACAHQFPLHDIYKQRIDDFFAFDDTSNSDRLLEAVRVRSLPCHKRNLAGSHSAMERDPSRPTLSMPASLGSAMTATIRHDTRSSSPAPDTVET